MRWLHTMWPAGTVEKLPVVNEDGSTNVPGLYVVGDLTGIPLLKFSADTGARAVQTIACGFGGEGTVRSGDEGQFDLVIIGGGVSGMAAALEAKKHRLRFVVIEASEPFSTIVNFPRGKPIFTYPTEMIPAGDLQFHATVKEPLVDEIREQTLGRGIQPVTARVERVRRDGGGLVVELAQPAKGVALPFPSPELKARYVIVAIGRSGNFRKLGVPGEDMGKVYNRLHDPKEWAGKNVLVVGGGDSAVETAIAITQYGGNVVFSFRDAELTRPKPENVEKFKALLADPMAPVQVERPKSERVSTAVGGFMEKYKARGSLTALPASKVKAIGDDEVVVTTPAGDRTFPNDAVFAMIGREAPLDFFRKSGVKVHGDRSFGWWATLILSICVFTFIYHWKKGGVHILGFPPFSWIAHIGNYWSAHKLFPHNVPDWWASLGGAFANPANLLGTLKVTLGEPGFYYSLLYCTAIVFFGLKRIARRKTPYVKAQTYSLMAFQIIPLFLLPYIVLPWAGHNGWFDGGPFKWIADQLFPIVSYGHGREYWRAFGFILAWPLFIWNVFTEQPMWLWLGISLVQTFVIIPAIIYFWGKGAYCGWICSCGALAETMGDAHRTKMPHGPFWNRFNMVGQAFLLFAFVLLVLRVLGWAFPGSWFGRAFAYLLHDVPVVNYVWFVDLLWAGIIGVALYWHFSGRMWCRFACPLAALMHIYSRFSRFRIIPEKKKCISCNVCTSVCHQGIDIMNFANKGLPMADPQCVRCSACVQSCPTGVLSFGQVNLKTGEVIRKDRLAASPVQIREIGIKGRLVAV
jgi:thioredoxin reductase/ferredoxin